MEQQEKSDSAKIAIEVNSQVKDSIDNPSAQNGHSAAENSAQNDKFSDNSANKTQETSENIKVQIEILAAVNKSQNDQPFPSINTGNQPKEFANNTNAQKEHSTTKNDNLTVKYFGKFNSMEQSKEIKEHLKIENEILVADNPNQSVKYFLPNSWSIPPKENMDNTSIQNEHSVVEKDNQIIKVSIPCNTSYQSQAPLVIGLGKGPNTDITSQQELKCAEYKFTSQLLDDGQIEGTPYCFINEKSISQQAPKPLERSKLPFLAIGKPTDLVDFKGKRKQIEKQVKTQPAIELVPQIINEGSKLKIRQPFKILTDIWGVLTSYQFRKNLFEYIDANIKGYIVKNFDTEDIKLYVEDLVTRTKEDIIKYPDMPNISNEESDKESIIESVLANIDFRRHHKDKNLMKYLDSIFNQIWNEGYSNKTLRPHVFPDVIPNLKKWHSDPFYIKIYTFASGPVEIQKLFLSATVEGDVSEWITSGFDAHHRYKYDTSKYRGVLSSLSEREAKNLFYLTDSPTKGKAARKTGMTVFIVLREGNRKYKPEDLKQFTTIQSFDSFDFYEFC